VQVVEDKDKRTKGVDSHKDYMEVIKMVLMRMLAPALECDQSVRAAATLFKDYTITISHS
jgi:hypothetical protein